MPGAVGGHPGDFNGRAVVKVSGDRPAGSGDADQDAPIHDAHGEPHALRWPVVAVVGVDERARLPERDRHDP